MTDNSPTSAELLAEARAFTEAYPSLRSGSPADLVDRLTLAHEAVTAERDALAVILAEAPHALGCLTNPLHGPYQAACDCWKSKLPVHPLATRDAQLLRDEAERFEQYVADGGPVALSPEVWLRRRAAKREAQR